MEQLRARIDQMYTFRIDVSTLCQKVCGTQAYDAAAEYDGIGVFGRSKFASHSWQLRLPAGAGGVHSKRIEG